MLGAAEASAHWISRSSSGRQSSGAEIRACSRKHSAKCLGADWERPPSPGAIIDAEEYFLTELKLSGLGDFSVHVGLPPVPLIRDEDHLLDFLELLHRDCVSEPHREHSGAGTHFHPPYNKEAGQRVFREKINPHLAMHDPPLELLESGQIVERAPDELRGLVAEEVPETVEAEIRDPLEAAVAQFQRRGSTPEERRGAVKGLADVLERMRPEIKRELLSEDERALFDLANNFSIRHNKRDQRGDYDKDVWLEWAFYVYLATARAMIALGHGGQTSSLE